MAWSVPALAVASQAPAFAASRVCGDDSKALIDLAFTLTSEALVAYWTLDTESQLNGHGGARPYLNLHNNLPFDLLVLGGQLQVRMTAYFADTDRTQWETSLVASSYGTVSPLEKVVYNNSDAQTWLWTIGNRDGVLKGSGEGSDNTADIVFTNPGSLVHSPPGTIVCSELVSAPRLVPTFESLQLVYPAITEDCRDYYEAKTAITPTIAFSGPLVTGATVWNNDGDNLHLNGGSVPWTVGTTVCSDTVGNYISRVRPPATRGIDYGYDGIF